MDLEADWGTWNRIPTFGRELKIALLNWSPLRRQGHFNGSFLKCSSCRSIHWFGCVYAGCYPCRGLADISFSISVQFRQDERPLWKSLFQPILHFWGTLEQEQNCCHRERTETIADALIMSRQLVITRLSIKDKTKSSQKFCKVFKLIWKSSSLLLNCGNFAVGSEIDYHDKINVFCANFTIELSELFVSLLSGSRLAEEPVWFCTFA